MLTFFNPVIVTIFIGIICVIVVFLFVQFVGEENLQSKDSGKSGSENHKISKPSAKKFVED